MNESGRVRGRPIDRTAAGRSGAGLTIAVLVMCGGWLLLALVAMLVSTSPDFGPVSGTAQHLVLGLILSIVITAAMAIVTNWGPAETAWAAAAGTSVALLGYELLQIAVPVRAFQWIDLTNGIAGVAIGGFLSLLGLRIGEWFIAAVAGFGGVALVIAAIGLVVLPSDELRAPIEARLSDCGPATTSTAGTLDWTDRLLPLTLADSGCVVAGPVELVPFGAALVTPQTNPSSGVGFDGGGLASGPLDDLPESITASGAITFGIRFNSAITDQEVTPTVLARLVVDGDPARPIVSMLQRGPHLTVNVGSGRPVIGIGLPLADRAAPGDAQELVVTYESGVAKAYLDGQLIGEGLIDPFEFTVEDALKLEIGWRADERWSPFTGTVSALVIADRAFDRVEVASAFEP